MRIKLAVIVDDVVENKYANNPGKLATLLSANRIKKAPKKKESPTL